MKAYPISEVKIPSRALSPLRRVFIYSPLIDFYKLSNLIKFLIEQAKSIVIFLAYFLTFPPVVKLKMHRGISQKPHV
jgi:hypothetical protein